MSNHYHVVLYIDHDTAKNWSLDEVIKRWHLIFNGSLLTHRHLSGDEMSHAERDAVVLLFEVWRKRLMVLWMTNHSLQSPIGSARSDWSSIGQPTQLLPFIGNPREDMPKGLPFCLTEGQEVLLNRLVIHQDYLELVDWTGRAIREGKRGSISNQLPPILERLQIDPKHWLYMTQHFESRFKGLVGSVFTLKKACQKLGYQRTISLTRCKQLLS